MAFSDIRVCISVYARPDPRLGTWYRLAIRARWPAHLVWAVTRRKTSGPLPAELSRAPLPNLQMVYYDLPSARVWKHGQIGIKVYYRL